MDDEDDTLEGLFVCEDYVSKTFEFDDVRCDLLCSNMSCTDHDLTGQIVWPASLQLSWFLAKHRSAIASKTVVELGAGCGLGGFVAAQFTSKSIITDGNEIVVRLLERNKAHVKETPLQYPGQIEVKKLLWGLKDEVTQVVSDHGVVDVLIGADVILWPLQVFPLLRTVRWFLSAKAETSVAYISYIVRAKSTTDLVHKHAKDLGLSIEVVESHTFLPHPQPDCLAQLDKCVFCIRIAEPVGVSLDREPAEDPDAQSTIDSLNGAC
jgi:hypothetical protein